MVEIMNAVIAALAAGAAVGFADTASAAVKDSYQFVKSSTSRLMRRNGQISDAELEEQLADPEANRDALAAALAEADETEREQLKAAADHLVGMLNSARSDRPAPVLWHSPGSVVGDHATVTNTFGQR